MVYRTVNRPDEELVAGALEGDRSAFETLVRRHFRAAWARALAVVRDPTSADDVCQDAFVRAWERLRQCHDPRRFRAWLLSVVRSVALNRLRAEKVRAARPIEDVVSLAATDTTSRRVRTLELRDQLLAALEELTEREREVLLLSDLEGWRHREIAETLNISEVMSRRHLSDGRRKARELLRASGLHLEIR